MSSQDNLERELEDTQRAIESMPPAEFSSLISSWKKRAERLRNRKSKLAPDQHNQIMEAEARIFEKCAVQLKAASYAMKQDSRKVLETLLEESYGS